VGETGARGREAVRLDPRGSLSGARARV